MSEGTVTSSMPAVAGRPARASRGPLLAALLLGLSAGVDAGPASLYLQPSLLLPLLAAWWARRDGPRVALPLALLTLLPSVGVRLDVLSLSYSHSDVACLTAVGVALAVGADRATQDAAAALRGWRGGLALVGALIWALAAADGSRASAGGLEFRFGMVPIALPAVVLVLVAVDWRRIAEAIGYRPAAHAGIVAALILLATVFDASWYAQGVSLRIGSTSAAALVPAACLAVVLCGWVGWVRVASLLAAAALAAQGLLSMVGPLGPWVAGLTGLPGPRAYPEPWMLLLQGVAAAWMGDALRSLRDEDAAKDPWRVARSWLPLAAIALVLLVPPALSEGQVRLWTTGTWVLAGACFLAGRRWGGRGAIAAPLALSCLVMALAVGVDPGRNLRMLATDLPTASGMMLAYALAGWLASRGATRGARGIGVEAASVDLSTLARVVQEVDQMAAMRAFWALLVPAFVLWQLAGVGTVIDFGLRFDDLGDDLPWGWVLAVGVLVVLWPLNFVLMDWVDRQDRLRFLSGVSGALLALLGAAVIVLAPGMLLPALLDDTPGVVQPVAVVLLLAGAAAATLWMAGRSRATRTTVRIVAAAYALLAAAALVALVELLDEEGRPQALLEVAAALAATVFLVAAWVRAVRRRFVLAEDRPRALLFGALPQRSPWARFAALLGLPSSMWTASALRRPPAWAFLLSRPLVYLAFAAVKASLPLGLGLVLAGHAAFAGAKRLAARQPWRPGAPTDPRPPVLFLRSFEDDQFDFRRPAWQLRLRWLDLWSFRRNVDEALVDEFALYGPVVALGRPGEQQAPFGATRHQADHDDWQDIVTRTARGALAVVLVAGESPGLRWEFDLLRREALLDRTVLLLHPDPARDASNRRAIGWLLGDDALAGRLLGALGDARPVALLPSRSGPRLLTVDTPSAAAYVVALRAHFQGDAAADLTSLAG